MRFQSALYSYYRGDYSIALIEFQKLSDRFERAGDTAHAIECSVYILRILAEREEFDLVSSIENKILRVLKQNKEKTGSHFLDAKLRSRVLYVLGICHVYRSDAHELAMEKFRDSIQAAVECGDRSALAWPLYGAATVLYARNRYTDALNELEKLRTLLSCCPVAELCASASLLQALIFRNSNQLDDALESAWHSFSALKTSPHLVLYLHTLATLGTIYTAKGDPSKARVYLELAERSLRRSEFPRIARIVDEALGQVALKGDHALFSEFDLRFDEESGTLLESSKGEIKFEGQFLLRDLLKIFLKSPGRAIKKEDLVQQVWGESYIPTVHDNKIYVNIKRLRRLIESKDGSIEYILRGKQGYYLNPKTRVVLVGKSTP